MLPVGETSVGGARWSASLIVFETPPPGLGVRTVIDGALRAAMSAAVTRVLSWLPLRNVVVRLTPFHCTTEPCAKLLPPTTSVNPAPPAAALWGERLDTAGAGLGISMAEISA